MSSMTANVLETKTTNISNMLILLIGLLVAVPVTVAVSVAVTLTLMKQQVSALQPASNQTPVASLDNSRLASAQTPAANCVEQTQDDQGHVLSANTDEETTPPAPHKHAMVHTATTNTTNNTSTTSTTNNTTNNVYNDYSNHEKNVAINNTNTNVHVNNEVNIENNYGDKKKHHGHDKDYGTYGDDEWNKDKHHDDEDEGNDTNIDFNTEVNVNTANVQIHDVNVNLNTPAVPEAV